MTDDFNRAPPPSGNPMTFLHLTSQHHNPNDNIPLHLPQGASRYRDMQHLNIPVRIAEPEQESPQVQRITAEQESEHPKVTAKVRKTFMWHKITQMPDLSEDY